MNGQLLENRKWSDEQESDVLDVLAQSDAPALATDATGHVIFWNHAAELLLGRGGRQVMGRRCYDVVCGRDVFGNRFCHENCAVVSMSRKGESVQGFEIVLGASPKQEQNISVSVLKVPGSRPELFTARDCFRAIWSKVDWPMRCLLMATWDATTSSMCSPRYSRFRIGRSLTC